MAANSKYKNVRGFSQIKALKPKMWKEDVYSEATATASELPG